MKQKHNETFSYKVKSEAILNINNRKKSDSCFMGLLLTAEYNPDLQNCVFRTDCDIVKELFVRLAEHACETIGCTEIEVVHSRGKAPIYEVRLKNIESVAKRLGLSYVNEKELIKKSYSLSEKNFGSFAAGVFLACGSVASPDKEYHLEFAFSDENTETDFSQLIYDRIGIMLKHTKRQKRRSLYLKGSEGIEDVLTLIGAPMSSLELMNVKVYKDIRNRANRATNCDTANCERQNLSSARQIEAIKRIECSVGGLSILSDELRKVCELRIKYPEYNLSELAMEFDPPLSKSGINHRLARIEEIAESLSYKKEE